MANKKNKRYTREFSYTRPIMYQGKYYPSTDSVISDEYGNKTNGTIFADTYGQYYTKDKDNNVFPVMPMEKLDEVTVTAKDMREPIMFNHYLTMNDNTQVRNLPHREYNTSLKAKAERGARKHALWDKEHPNLSAWRDAATAVPFAVASAPLVLGGGQGLLGTTAGQAAKHGIAAIMENPYVAGANDVLGLGFAGKGTYDVSQGKFTPETAIEITGFYPFGKSLTGLNKVRHISKEVDAERRVPKFAYNFMNRETPFSFNQNPIDLHIQRVKAKEKYDPSILKVYNLSEDSPKTTQLINQIANENGWTFDYTKEYLTSYLEDHGHAAAFMNTGKIIRDNELKYPNVYISHEIDHALHTPKEPLSEGILENPDPYFVQFNNTEVAARGSQIHDYLGHTGNEPITVEDLEYAKDNYVKDTGIDNNMSELFSNIRDYDALAKWMTKYSTGIVPLGIMYNNQSKQ